MSADGAGFPPGGRRDQDGRFLPGFSGNPERQFRPGQSGNPVGKSRVLADIQKMLDEEHRGVERMREVFDRLRALALGTVVHVPDGDGAIDIQLQADPAFMKLYLDRVLGPVKELITDEDLRDAPDVVIDWLRRAS